MDASAMGIDLDQVSELTTQVGTSGALGIADLAADPVFEFTIGIVVLVSAA